MALTGPDTTDHASGGGDADGSGRLRTLATLGELLSLSAGLLTEGPRTNLASARFRLSEDRLNLVVLGEFKRGKSTLINALLERDVLPTGVVPLTSVITTIGAGDRDRLIVHFADGRREERPVSELGNYVTEPRNPGNGLDVELARVELDHPLLRAGIELVDTPGIGSVHSHNTQITRDFLPRVDVAVCVLDAGQPLTERERELFLEASQRVPRLLFVVNKIDHVDAPDRQVAERFVRSGLRELSFGVEPEVFAVSAREHLGLAKLRARLGRLAASERDALLWRSVAGLGLGLARDTVLAAQFESHAIELPLEELASRAQIFEDRIGELSSASAEAGDLLDQGIRRALEQSVNQPLKEHANRRAASLRAALRGHVEELDNRSPRELSAELETWVDATVRQEFERLVPHFEAVIADQLAELERGYAGRVEQVLASVQAVAESVFGTRASDVLPDTGLHTRSRFSFKLKDAQHALDMIVGFGRTVAPGALGRKLVVRDAEQRLIEMTDRHAGRLRSELAERVSDSAREYRRELAARVDEAIDAIRAAIDRAVDEQRRGEDHARARLRELARVERRSEQIAVNLDRWLTDPDLGQACT